MIPSIDRGIARLIADALVLAMSAICNGADEKFCVNEYAFNMAAESAFSAGGQFVFEPLSITTYADGHRMLSITGAVMQQDKVKTGREQMVLDSVPGAVRNWDELVDVEIPQLTIWEKLTLDREIHTKSSVELAAMIDFKLHESIPTTILIDGFRSFQRFYPTFRHVLL